MPADRVGELAAELAPVLALLADTEREAERIRATAGVAAAERLRAGRAEADAIIANAEVRADVELATLRAEGHAAAATERTRLETAAARRADQIREHAGAHLDELAEQAAAPLLALLLDDVDRGTTARRPDDVRAAVH